MEWVIQLEDEALQYRLRRSKRAKRVTIRVGRGGQVVVTVPWYVAYRYGEAFLRQRVAWVKRVQERQRKHVGLRSPLPEPVKRELVAEYRKLAQEYFEGAVDSVVRELGASLPRVKISDFRSQWGSCNRRTNTLKFSWRLMLAPQTVARYVAVHEVAHLIHASHSKLFWQVVAKLDPQYQASRRWLRQHGTMLHM